MCLTLEQLHATAPVAIEDMVVYKCLSFGRNRKYQSPVFGDVEWEVGKLYTVDEPDRWNDTKNKATSHFFLGYGFHSIRVKATALKWSSQLYVFKAIIPKGSEYYLGDNDEVISNHIKLVRKLWFNRF